MKQYFFILIFLSQLVYGQDSISDIFPFENEKVTYTKIVEINGKKKDLIYMNIKEWGINSFRSIKYTLEAEDKESGFIVYKYYFDFVDYYWGGISKGKPYKLKVYNTLKFYIKDEKLKIVLTDFEIEALDYNYSFFGESKKSKIDEDKESPFLQKNDDYDLTA